MAWRTLVRLSRVSLWKSKFCFGLLHVMKVLQKPAIAGSVFFLICTPVSACVPVFAGCVQKDLVMLHVDVFVVFCVDLPMRQLGGSAQPLQLWAGPLKRVAG